MRDASRPHQQTEVEEYDKYTSYQSHFFDDNRKDKVGECLTEEITLDGVSRSFAHYVTGSDGNTGMGDLCVFVYIEFGCGHFVFIKEAFNTVLPSLQTMKSGGIVQRFGRDGNYRTYAECDNQHKSSCQQKEFLCRYPSDEHHHEYDTEQQHGCRQVFWSNQQKDQSGKDHDVFKGFGVGSFFILPLGQDERNGNDDSHLCQFRRLELQSHKGHPAGCPIDTVACNDTHQRDECQQNEGNRIQEDGEYLEPFVGDVMQKYHYYGTYHQDDRMLCYRSPVVAAFVRQRRCCRKHLDNRDEAETEEDNPDYLVAFKYAL